MSFEDKILAVSKLKQRLLKRPAGILAKKLDTGVVIENKSAYFVIRDCAMLAADYLPIFIYGALADPFNILRGKLTEKDIIDFVARAQKNKHTQQLLHLIFIDIAKKQGNAIIEQPRVRDPDPVIDFSEDSGDIYGDYDYIEEVAVQAQSQTTSVSQPLSVDLTDNRAVIDKLIEIFGAVREAN